MIKKEDLESAPVLYEEIKNNEFVYNHITWKYIAKIIDNDDKYWLKRKFVFIKTDISWSWKNWKMKIKDQELEENSIYEVDNSTHKKKHRDYYKFLKWNLYMLDI